MIAILIMLFKDYRKPIIIFCSLPMLLVGVVAVMLLTDKNVQLRGNRGYTGTDRHAYQERHRLY